MTTVKGIELSGVELSPAEVRAVIIAPTSLRVSIMDILAQTPCYGAAEAEISVTTSRTVAERNTRGIAFLGALNDLQTEWGYKFMADAPKTGEEQDAFVDAFLVKLKAIVDKNDGPVETFMDLGSVARLMDKPMIECAKEFLCEKHQHLADLAYDVTADRQNREVFDTGSAKLADALRESLRRAMTGEKPLN